MRAAILALRLTVPAPPPDAEACIATLTVRYGAIIVKGMRLCHSAGGSYFLKPPAMRSSEDRIIFQPGPERAALLDQAKRMLLTTQEARTAVPPLAPALDEQESRL